MNLDEAKRYKDPFFKVTFITLGTIVAIIVISDALALYVRRDHIQEDFPSILFSLLLLVVVIALFAIILLRTTFATVEVSRYTITWRCPFHKTVTLAVADCVSVGIRPFTAYRHGRPMLTSYTIYLSKEPLTKKAKEKLTEKAPKNGLIWFPYSDELCLHLIKVLPASKTRSLEGLYNQKQDEKRELEKIKAKRKRMREKEKQRKKEQKNKK